MTTLFGISTRDGIEVRGTEELPVLNPYGAGARRFLSGLRGFSCRLPGPEPRQNRSSGRWSSP